MFTTYDISLNKLNIKSEIPYFCELYFPDRTKRCQNFYSALCTSSSSNGFHQCPYGFSCLKTENHIYTGLIINGHSDLSKVYPHLTTYKQTINSFTNYSKEQIYKIISGLEMLEHEIDIYSLTIHDIKNATKSMLDLTEQFDNDSNVAPILNSNKKIYDACIGYGLIKYRLDYHDLIIGEHPSTEQRKGRINAHKIIKKLTHQLYYRAQKKDISFVFCGYTSNELYQFASVYLGFFLLLENAIKYSNEREQIKICFEDKSTSHTKITISNTCLSMNKEEIPLLFNKGYRASSAKSVSNGNGLGLSLAKTIFEDAQSTLNIDFEQNSKNKGVFISTINLFDLNSK